MLNRHSLTSLLLRPQVTLPALEGPALVVGSGPGAAVPYGFDDSWTVATVNASQVVASSLGCGSPDLTLFGKGVLRDKAVNREAQHAIRGLGSRAVIWQNRKGWLRVRLAMLGYSYSRIHFLTEEVRLDIIAEAVGRRIEREARPSNGILLALICLHLGSSRVVMTGFSLTQAGHSYNDKGRDRNHVDEDMQVLAEALARGARVFTNDAKFASESGVPIYSRGDESVE